MEEYQRLESNQNIDALDKHEAALRSMYGPAIISITKNFREPSLLLQIDEKVMAEITDSEYTKTYSRSVDKAGHKDPMKEPVPDKVPSSYDRIRQVIQSIPFSVGFGTIIKGSSRPGEFIIRYKSN